MQLSTIYYFDMFSLRRLRKRTQKWCHELFMYRSRIFTSIFTWFVLVGACFVITGFIVGMTLWISTSRTDEYLREVKSRHLLDTSLQMEELRPFQMSCPPCPPQKMAPPIVLPASGNLTNINCSINNQYLVGCKKDENEKVYMPASFVNQYFEVFGETKPYEKGQIYHFQHSDTPLIALQPTYSPFGVFLNFQSFRVEARKFVMCLTAAEGVPLTTQWDPKGYWYPISIAQFGLNHHAKALFDTTSGHIEIVSGHMNVSKWVTQGKGPMSVTQTEADVDGVTKKVLAFNSSESLSADGPTLSVRQWKMLGLCVKLRMVSAGGITIAIINRDKKIRRIHYDHSDSNIEILGDSDVKYGIKSENIGKWITLVRDLEVDWQKDEINRSHKLVQIVNITLHGKGFIEYITVGPQTHHIEMLKKAADWFVQNQDGKGGWSTSVPYGYDGIALPKNWYSAMGQGQAISCLVRAYNVTGIRQYLDTAGRALHLYTVSSSEGGVKARFLDQLDWYEEYPTTPGSFVLNGFIYSLLGLYDASVALDGDARLLAEQLWNSGVTSLKTLLGAFDTGTGTVYDLRHVTHHIPPNRARWGYHATHIALMQQMAVIDGDSVFYEAANRWISYTSGSRSKHN